MLHTSWCKSSSVQRMWEHWLAAGNIHSHSSKLMYFEGKRLYPWYLFTRLIRLTAQRKGARESHLQRVEENCCICMRVRKQPHVHVPLEGFEGRISQAASKPLDSLNRLYSNICRSLSKSSQISIFFVFCFFFPLLETLNSARSNRAQNLFYLLSLETVWWRIFESHNYKKGGRVIKLKVYLIKSTALVSHNPPQLLRNITAGQGPIIFIRKINC